MVSSLVCAMVGSITAAIIRATARIKMIRLTTQPFSYLLATATVLLYAEVFTE
jgi:hypothetical protein